MAAEAGRAAARGGRLGPRLWERPAGAATSDSGDSQGSPGLWGGVGGCSARCCFPLEFISAELR